MHRRRPREQRRLLHPRRQELLLRHPGQHDDHEIGLAGTKKIFGRRHLAPWRKTANVSNLLFEGEDAPTEQQKTLGGAGLGQLSDAYRSPNAFMALSMLVWLSFWKSSIKRGWSRTKVLPS